MKYRAKAGIYKITNIVNGKMYIGSSSSLKSRKYEHFSSLLKNKHHSQHLQRAYNKYGKDNFIWEIIEYINYMEDKAEFKKVLLDKEQYWIDKLDVCNQEKGYNTAPIAGSPLGVKHTEKARSNMSNAHKGIRHTEETKRKLSTSNRGKVLSEETKKKISRAHKGRKHTDVSRKHMSNGQKKRIITEETRNKMRQSLKGKLKGRKLSEETKRKLSESHKGKPSHRKGVTLSEETKIKMSISNKGKVSNSKKIINLTTGKIFSSIKEAGIYYSINNNNISSVCSGKRKTAGGFEWEYLNENIRS